MYLPISHIGLFQISPAFPRWNLWGSRVKLRHQNQLWQLWRRNSWRLAVLPSWSFDLSEFLATCSCTFLLLAFKRIFLYFCMGWRQWLWDTDGRRKGGGHACGTLRAACYGAKHLQRKKSDHVLQPHKADKMWKLTILKAAASAADPFYDLLWLISGHHHERGSAAEVSGCCLSGGSINSKKRHPCKTVLLGT